MFLRNHKLEYTLFFFSFFPRLRARLFDGRGNISKKKKGTADAFRSGVDGATRTCPLKDRETSDHDESIKKSSDDSEKEKQKRETTAARRTLSSAVSFLRERVRARVPFA